VLLVTQCYDDNSHEMAHGVDIGRDAGDGRCDTDRLDSSVVAKSRRDGCEERQMAIREVASDTRSDGYKIDFGRNAC
jgi:hypothetical protein